MSYVKSGMNMKLDCFFFFFETLAPIFEATKCHNPEDSNYHTHHNENLKPYILSFCYPSAYRNNSFESLFQLLFRKSIILFW